MTIVRRTLENTNRKRNEYKTVSSADVLAHVNSDYLSVCLSVCHAGDIRLNGSRYRSTLHTARQLYL